VLCAEAGMCCSEDDQRLKWTATLSTHRSVKAAKVDDIRSNDFFGMYGVFLVLHSADCFSIWAQRAIQITTDWHMPLYEEIYITPGLTPDSRD